MQTTGLAKVWVLYFKVFLGIFHMFPSLSFWSLVGPGGVQIRDYRLSNLWPIFLTEPSDI
jgi:hypothetical protein